MAGAARSPGDLPAVVPYSWRSATSGSTRLARRLGEAGFRKELLAQMSERLGAGHYGEERAQTEAGKAERIVAEEGKRREWKATEFQTRPKGEVEKVALAARVRWRRR